MLLLLGTSCSDIGGPPQPGLRAASDSASKVMRPWIECWYDSAYPEDWNCDVGGYDDVSDYASDLLGSFTTTYVSTTDCRSSPGTCPTRGGGITGGDYGVGSPPGTADDADLLPPPECSGSTPTDSTLKSNRDAIAWCIAHVPEGFRLTRIQQALEDMRTIDPACAHLASIADTLIANQRLRLFDKNEDPTHMVKQGGNAPFGGGATGDNAYLVIDVNFVDLWWNPAHATKTDPSRPYRRDLQQALAHELDHLDGASPVHADAGNYTTPHSQMCSRL